MQVLLMRFVDGSAYGIRTRDLRLERAVSLAARRMRHARPIPEVAGDRGFEPRLTDPESVVLPLDESPVQGILSGRDIVIKQKHVFTFMLFSELVKDQKVSYCCQLEVCELIH